MVYLLVATSRGHGLSTELPAARLCQAHPSGLRPLILFITPWLWANVWAKLQCPWMRCYVSCLLSSSWPICTSFEKYCLRSWKDSIPQRCCRQLHRAWQVAQLSSNLKKSRKSSFLIEICPLKMRYQFWYRSRKARPMESSMFFGCRLFKYFLLFFFWCSQEKKI